jgi:hypothetical protein
MKKTLLVGGDSFSDPYYSENKPNNITSWPILLAKKLNMNLVCVSQSGAGNEQIYSSLLDYICDHNSEDIGLVISAWSKSQRMDFETSEEGYTHYSTGRRLYWSNAPINPRGGVYYFIRKSIRNFYSLQMLCEHNNIQCKQLQMLPLFSDYIEEFNMDKELEAARFRGVRYIRESAQYDYINKDNFIGWPIYDEDDGFVVGDITVHDKEYFNNKDNSGKFIIGNGDDHPNNEGHKMIMEFIYENL